MNHIPLATLVLLATSAGCSFSPYHLENFNNTTSTIPFEGCSLQPNSPISVELLNGRTGQWETASLGSSSSTVSYTDSESAQWYCWQRNATIGPNFWIPKTGGTFFTFMRVLDNGQPVYTYSNDPSQCTQPAGTDQLTNAQPCALAPSNSGIGRSRPGGIIITASQL